jgi:GT2 family glycosyltransferase
VTPANGAPPDLSISVIDTDNRELTLQCLRSLADGARRVSLELLVVDNACTDGSAEAIAAEFPDAVLLHNAERRGFSTNNNLALARSHGRYAMILNDDTIVGAGALDRLVSFMDRHPEVGAVGPRLLNADGSIQQSVGKSPHPLFEPLHPLSNRLRRLDWRPEVPTEVDAISGACLMVRREVLDQVGGLDPAFDPLYSEEVDWCHRIRGAGWPIYHLPEATVVHLGSQTMNRAPRHKLERLYEKKALFFRKHHGPGSVLAFKATLASVSALKAAAWAALVPLRGAEAREKAGLHWHIARAARRL